MRDGANEATEGQSRGYGIKTHRDQEQLEQREVQNVEGGPVGGHKYLRADASVK